MFSINPKKFEAYGIGPSKVAVCCPHMDRPILTSCVLALNQQARYRTCMDLPPAICLPSVLQAQAVTFDRPPLSFDLTTMTDFDLRRSAVFQIRKVLSSDADTNRDGFLWFQASEVTAATCPLNGIAKTIRVAHSSQRRTDSITHSVCRRSLMYGSPLMKSPLRTSKFQDQLMI